MNKNGITLIQLVLTIIVMLILISVAIFYAQDIPGEAKMSEVYSEIRELKSSINEADMLDELKIDLVELSINGEIRLPLVTTDSSKKNYSAYHYIEESEYNKITNNDNASSYYYLDFTTSNNLQNVLSLENIKNNYLLRYNDLKLYLVNGIDTNNDTVTMYSADDIEKYYENTFRRK